VQNAWVGTGNPEPLGLDYDHNMQNMKQLAAKSEAFSLPMPEASPAGEVCSDERAVALRDSFDGWLSLVAPKGHPKSFQTRSAATSRSRRPLTAADIVHVNRATIRESKAPRIWPPDVVLSFLAADVITRK
jgi:hypothetical protein